MLSIDKKVIFDESVEQYEVRVHQPYASSTFNNNDEIRIAVQNQDAYILPCKSSLHFQGRITGVNLATNVQHTTLVSNAICHMFEEMRYELNSTEIERVKNVGLTTAIKAYISQSSTQEDLLENAGWIIDEAKSLTNDDGYFDISIPLGFIFGFAEDYQRIIVNSKHELILVRSNTDTNAVLQTAAAAVANTPFKITLNKIEWMVPYIKVSDREKINMLGYIAKDPPIAISFRSWELYEYPLLPLTTKHIWCVKTSTQLEKPRYIIAGFQTDRKNSRTTNATQFDNCNLRDMKLFLNSQCYPYVNLNINFTQNQFAGLYEMYANFQSSYYGRQNSPLLTKTNFKNLAPLVVIDCAKQNEALITGPVDIRLEFESSEQFAARTAAFCLIIHDKIIEYQPISGIVKKLV